MVKWFLLDSLTDMLTTVEFQEGRISSPAVYLVVMHGVMMLIDVDVT